jgi:hypothetical protein
MWDEKNTKKYLIFYFFKKRKPKKKKLKKKILGVAGHPHFGQGVAQATPYVQSGGSQTTLKAKMGVDKTHSQKAKMEKKKNWSVGSWEWPNHPQAKRG